MLVLDFRVRSSPMSTKAVLRNGDRRVMNIGTSLKNQISVWGIFLRANGSQAIRSWLAPRELDYQVWVYRESGYIYRTICVRSPESRPIGASLGITLHHRASVLYSPLLLSFSRRSRSFPVFVICMPVWYSYRYLSHRGSSHSPAACGH